METVKHINWCEKVINFRPYLTAIESMNKQRAAPNRLKNL